MAREAVDRHEIVQIVLKESIPERHICIVYDRHRQMSTAAKPLKSTIMEMYTHVKH